MPCSRAHHFSGWCCCTLLCKKHAKISAVLFLQFLNEGRPFDPQQLGGLVLDAVSPLQGFINKTKFHSFQKIFQIDPLRFQHGKVRPDELPASGAHAGRCSRTRRPGIGKISADRRHARFRGCGGGSRRRLRGMHAERALGQGRQAVERADVIADLGGQVVHLHTVAIHENAQALHEVFQLAHIARPAVGKQHPGRILAKPQQRPAFFLAESLQKALCEDEDIHPSFAQGRQVQRDDVQAVVEVFTETSGRDFAFQIPVGGGHDAHIHLFAARAAHTFYFLFLQDAQDLHLQAQIHFTYFIKKDGAAVSQFKTAGA